VVLDITVLKMARVIVVFRVMPKGLKINLVSLQEILENKIKEFGGNVGKVETEPIAFGLNAIKLFVILDESKGTDELEKELAKVKGVQSANVIDVRRAVG